MPELYPTFIKYKFFYWVAVLAVLAYIIIEATGQGDFWVFLEAAQRLHQGGNIYGESYGDGYHYFYSILFALLLIPFTYFPSFIVHFLWLLLDLFFLYRIWKIVVQHLNFSMLDEKQYLWFFILAWTFSFRFLYNNFHVIQMTIFLLYASLEGMNLMQEKQSGKLVAMGAALLALAINIKTLPIVLIPYLFYRNKIKEVCYVLFFVTLFFFLPALFIGIDYNWFLLKQWASLINPFRPIHVVDIDETGFHSLSSWLPALLMKNTSNNFTLPLKRNIAELDYQQVAVILNILRLALILFVFYFLRTRPFKTSPTQTHTFWELSYIFLLIPLIFPHQHIYAFFFLFPAGAYVVYFLMRQAGNKIKTNFIIISLTIASFLLLSIGGIIGTIDAFTQHYKFITYGALLLIIPLAMCRPKKNISNDRNLDV